jgi:peptidoglycan/LPS O-acetylase OafA/YrhL
VTQRAGDSWQPIVLTVQALLVWVLLTSVVSFPKSFAGRVLNWKPVAFLGVMSYSFYLVHRYYILWADEHLADTNRWLVAALTFAASLGTAYLIHLTIERPFGKLRRRISHVSTPRIRDRVDA